MTVAPTPASVAPVPPQFTDYLATLHEARTLALRDMPAGQETVLSAGPNGSWYFEWFDQAYGPVRRHVAVEAYVEQPPALPANVEWLSADLASAGGVAAVPAGGVDLVFSGQNVEHLWPDQLVAFLSEANRVLRPSGWLVMDSPNRGLTAAYRWSMGEHTVELLPDEAERLVALAGFEVVTTKGLWLCRDRGELLALGPETGDQAAVLRRMMLASRRPEDSFIWWLEARKARAPDVDALAREVTSIFRDNWEERAARLKAIDGSEVEGREENGGRPVATLPAGQSGYVAAGPWMPLPAGSYQLSLEVRWRNLIEPGEIGRLEVVAEEEVLGSIDLVGATHAGRMPLHAPLRLSKQRFYVQARVWSSGAALVEVPLHLHVSPRPF